MLYSPLLHFAISILRLLILIPLYPALANPYKTFTRSPTLAAQQAAEEEGNLDASTSITNPADVAYQASSGLLAPKPQYGTFTSTNGHQPSRTTSRTGTPPASSEGAEPKKPKTPAKPEISLDPTWREMGVRFKRLLPYLWPRESLKLKGLATFCLLLLVAGRFIAFLTPTTLRELVAMFDRVKQVPAPSPWKLLFLYVLLRFLQGSGGLAALRDVRHLCELVLSGRSKFVVCSRLHGHPLCNIQTDVSAASMRCASYPLTICIEMSQMAFDHLLSLSLAFHTRRKTGEILRILDRGQAINHIFEVRSPRANSYHLH